MVISILHISNKKVSFLHEIHFLQNLKHRHMLLHRPGCVKKLWWLSTSYSCSNWTAVICLPRVKKEEIGRKLISGSSNVLKTKNTRLCIICSRYVWGEQLFSCYWITIFLKIYLSKPCLVNIGSASKVIHFFIFLYIFFYLKNNSLGQVIFFYIFNICNARLAKHVMLPYMKHKER